MNSSSLSAMCNRIRHRGPDAEGYFLEGTVGLGHRRLSIIDLSESANQPLFSKDGAWVIVFNGEIYNYRELKSQLEQLGYGFQTSSDTEVILYAFQQYGVEAVHRFIGMFAFAIYHRPSACLYVFRDRVGVKPLYYYHKEQEFWFASELKAIATELPSKQVNSQAVSDYFRFGYIRNPYTIYNDVYKLPPGHYIKVQSGTVELNSYWDINTRKSKMATVSEEELVEELEGLLQSSFDYRMVADVPVGVFLSGGIDSSSLTALLARHHSNLKTFSIGFDDERYNEAPYARQIASYIGTGHHEQILTAADAEGVLDKYFDIYDEPFADSSGIPVFLISQFAKQNGCKVVLSADGGDELFGGYDRYKQVPLLYRKIKKVAAFEKLLQPMHAFSGARPLQRFNMQHRTTKVRDLMAAAQRGNRSEFYASFLATSPRHILKELTGVKPDIEGALGASSFEEEMMLWDFTHYLPEDLLTKVDRASMFTNIESREPFLDHRLIEFVFGLPLEKRIKPGHSKYLLKKVLFKYIPEELFNRRKMGFSIPLFKWFSEKLDKEFKHLFSPAVLSTIPVLHTESVLKEYKKYLYFKSIGKESNMVLMWHLFVFVKWWQKWMANAE